MLLLLAAMPPGPRVWETIRTSLERLHREYPIESTWLHTDRSLYQAGETLWFAAWHTEGFPHIPSTSAVVLRLELTDPLQGIAQTHLLRAIQGQACGSLHLPDTLPEGQYILRLSSTRMRSFSPPLYHEQKISVVNPKNSFGSRKLSRRMYGGEPQISFSPEGGALLAGKITRVGLRITDAYGYGISADYVVEDHRDKIIATGRSGTDGIGSFSFKPETGGKYTLVMAMPEGKSHKFRLPTVETTGAALSVSHREGMHELSLRSTGLQGPYLLIVQDPSGPCYSAE
ncbi:MAG: hypothetical protein IH599_08920, partial [Bacteroidales bacterium]|nr:hypothetical protein [Bacteroidales bacterium]